MNINDVHIYDKQLTKEEFNLKKVKEIKEKR